MIQSGTQQAYSHRVKAHRKRQQVQKALALRATGHTVRQSAKLAMLNPSTVQRLSHEELELAREHIRAAEMERAKRYQERSLELVGSANAAVANACVGTAIDKLLALGGEPSQVIRIEHLHAHISDEDLIQAMMAKRIAREAQAKVVVDTQSTV